jgi:hypothetical protein
VNPNQLGFKEQETTQRYFVFLRASLLWVGRDLLNAGVGVFEVVSSEKKVQISTFWTGAADGSKNVHASSFRPFKLQRAKCHQARQSKLPFFLLKYVTTM